MDAREIYRCFQEKAEEALSSKADSFIFAALDMLYLELDHLILRTVAENNISLACGTGCSYCCHLTVDAQAHEILYLHHALLAMSGKEDVERISKLSKRRHDALSRMNKIDTFVANCPCPLLQGGICSAYGSRPSLCRIFHAEKIDTCRYSHDNPKDLEAPNSRNPVLEQVTSAAIVGIGQVFEKMGYDKYAYDLGAALHEAFTNPVAYDRWKNRKPAFSRNARSRNSL